jgi:hypothetical protein
MKEVTALAIQQAELIIRLYELRREPVMRLARTYVGGEFLPASINDLLAAMSDPEHSAYILQVFGYWDMVAAMVFHGALDESFVYACCSEMYFQFAKISNPRPTQVLQHRRAHRRVLEWRRRTGHSACVFQRRSGRRNR